MEVKSIEIAIQHLTDTVLGLRDKVTTLEKIIFDQNHLIKKLVSASEKCIPPKFDNNIEAGEGRYNSTNTQQPIKGAHDRAKSATFAPTREIEGSRQPSEHAELPRVLTTSRSAPILNQRECLDTATMTHYQRDISAAAADESGTHDETDWINVRPRRSRRAPAAKGNKRHINGKEKKNVPLLGTDSKNEDDNFTQVKARSMAPIKRGSNTSILQIKGVER